MKLAACSGRRKGAPLLSDRLGELVEKADPAWLLRAVDGLCGDRDWAGLLRLRALLCDAVERGKPLWPVTTYVEYRIALEAPGPEVAQVLRSGVGRFALGPLTEVAAATHAWEELGPHLSEPGVAGTVAQERVMRGEDLRGQEGTHPEVLELPLALAPWEPVYPLATYRAAELEVPDPGLEPVAMVASTASPAEELSRPETLRALTDLVEVWTSESNGAARAVVIRGGPAEAVATLGHGEHRLGRLDPAGALARMAWAAASGGAYGVRRGAALGRFDAWWAATALAGVDWPPDPDELGRALARLTWWCWDDAVATIGWSLRLAVGDPDAGWAAALEASDHTE
jgi:hypothetical protein